MVLGSATRGNIITLSGLGVLSADLLIFLLKVSFGITVVVT